ncbi:MAG: hypothetical protein AAGA46_15015, partial [Cyanobacteria bacterium P01_F01_bin.13]
LFQLSTSMSTVDEACWEICGQSGKLIADRYRENQLEVLPAHRPNSRLQQLGVSLQGALRQLNPRKILNPTLELSYQGALTQFVKAMQSGQSIQPDLNDGLTALKVIAAAETAAQTGNVVSLADFTEEPQPVTASQLS